MARKSPDELPPPGPTVKKQEDRLITLAVDTAERMFLEGTAPPSIIVHYLKLGTTREQLEQERLRAENALLEARKATLEAQAHVEQLVADALKAFRSYHGDEDDAQDLY